MLFSMGSLKMGSGDAESRLAHMIVVDHLSVVLIGQVFYRGPGILILISNQSKYWRNIFFVDHLVYFLKDLSIKIN